jgi:hypothetical protein
MARSRPRVSGSPPENGRTRSCRPCHFGVFRYSRDKARLGDTLEVMKFLCKDFWQALFKKQVDNLKTNHRVGARQAAARRGRGAGAVECGRGRRATSAAALSQLHRAPTAMHRSLPVAEPPRPFHAARCTLGSRRALRIAPNGTPPPSCRPSPPGHLRAAGPQLPVAPAARAGGAPERGHNTARVPGTRGAALPPPALRHDPRCAASDRGPALCLLMIFKQGRKMGCEARGAQPGHAPKPEKQDS